ncbi:hypothetical protein [Paenibacillus flagellatus]|uniref:Copper resistance protein D domain-containing protein n=1 Tax=Paenibacillus flagellatus TaxID=2211139 RepID=A0A2V5KST6_9BACL|nr:hypothetical protein [Paenibacillus flagellatus]PYI52176.1 hypothetical protein DLM86_22130 [Paenibacillus flagellatus]
MFGFMLFLHLTGLFLWIGALLAVVLVLPLMKTQLGSGPSNTLAKRLIRVAGFVAHPGAAAVLVSGVYMILQLDLGKDRPLWLEVMEKGGGTLIVAALVVTGVMGSSIKKRLSAAGAGEAPRLTGYVTTTAAFLVLIVAVVFVVSMKL